MKYRKQIFYRNILSASMDSDEDSFLNELPKIQPRAGKKKNVIQLKRMQAFPSVNHQGLMPGVNFTEKEP